MFDPTIYSMQPLQGVQNISQSPNRYVLIAVKLSHWLQNKLSYNDFSFEKKTKHWKQLMNWNCKCCSANNNNNNNLINNNNTEATFEAIKHISDDVKNALAGAQQAVRQNLMQI